VPNGDPISKKERGGPLAWIKGKAKEAADAVRKLRGRT
jgi:hypothetical protein